jgi:NAD(P)-dependent dehydrogenase (short-subunit alcohol dehydrogenase family)
MTEETPFDSADLGRRRLADRIALVTGAGSSGAVTNIGHAIACLFALQGANVAVVDKDLRAAELTVQRAAGACGECVALMGDVSVESDCKRVVDQTTQRWGRLDILVNNVGVVARGKVTELGIADLRRTLDQNLMSAFLMSKHAMQAMPGGGSLVHLSSTAAVWPSDDTAYAIAKTGVEALSRAIAVQYATRGIRSNVVQPGFVWTEMAARQYIDEESRSRVRDSQRAVSALQTTGTAWDVAAAVLYFASDESRWVTAQVLTVDGGAHYRRVDFDAARGFRDEFDRLVATLRGSA